MEWIAMCSDDLTAWSHIHVVQPFNNLLSTALLAKLIFCVSNFCRQIVYISFLWLQTYPRRASLKFNLADYLLLFGVVIRAMGLQLEDFTFAMPLSFFNLHGVCKSWYSFGIVPVHLNCVYVVSHSTVKSVLDVMSRNLRAACFFKRWSIITISCCMFCF